MKIKCCPFEALLGTFHGMSLQSLPPDVYCIAVAHPTEYLLDK